MPLYTTSIAHQVSFHQPGNPALPDGPLMGSIRMASLCHVRVRGDDGFEHGARSAPGRQPAIHDGLGMSPALMISRYPIKAPLILSSSCRADVKTEAAVIYQRLAHQVPSHPVSAPAEVIFWPHDMIV